MNLSVLRYFSELQYGLYGSFLGCFIYIIFGSCKDVPVGPTAIASLLTYQTVAHLDDKVSHALLLCFIAGVFELLMGIFGLGDYSIQKRFSGSRKENNYYLL